MRLQLMFLFLFVSVFNLSAQKEQVKQSITETFTNYQNAYSNGSQALSLLYMCLKNASSADDAKAYARNAEDFVSLARKFADGAATEAAEAAMVAGSNVCVNSAAMMHEAEKESFAAKQHFDQSIKSLNAIGEKEEIADIMDLLMTSATGLQEGLKQLNEAAAHINSAVKGMKSCGENTVEE